MSAMKRIDSTRRALLAALAFAPLASIAAEPPVILVLGDSISAGFGLPPGAGWTHLLQKRLAERRYPHRVVNASISGDTTAGGRSRLPALLARHKPAIVVIELGGNDGLRGAPVATTRANLRRMIELAKAAPARVLLLGMRMPPNFGPTYTAQFEAMYAELARAQGAALVPFFLERIATDLGKFQPDRIHPTAAAQPELVATVWPALMKLLR